MTNMGLWDEAVLEETCKNNLLIVDGLNLAFRWKHKGQSDFAADFIRTVQSFAKSYNCRKVVVLNDYKGSAFRKAIHPRYKADRKERFKDQTEEEKQKNAEFFDGHKRTMELCAKNFLLTQLEGVEADDTSCYFVEAFEDGEVFDHIWLISTDHDWDELLGERVSRFAYTTRKEFTIDNFYDTHGCETPEEFTSMKAIMGDPGDSVYGVDGIGKKRAYNLVREYGSSLDLALKLPIEGSQKYIENLNQSEEKLILNTQLVDLRSFHREAIAFPEWKNLDKLDAICEKLSGE